jgi:hypothetical protein
MLQKMRVAVTFLLRLSLSFLCPDKMALRNDLVLTILRPMSAEDTRRKIMLRMGSSPDKAYTDKIAAQMIVVEKAINSEVEFVNYPANGKIAAKYKNGDSYEFFNYQDPMRDKKKPAGYKPPEIEYRKLTEVIEEDSSGPSSLGIFRYCLYVIFFIIFLLDIVIIWFFTNQIK